MQILIAMLKRVFICAGLIIAFMAIVNPEKVQAEVISGDIVDWPESGAVIAIGDGINDVDAWWSYNTTDKGFFYGSNISASSDSEVAHAVGITDISQISDASLFAFSVNAIGPFCDADCDPDGVGEFIVWRNSSGFYGVLRIDDIRLGDNPSGFFLSGTWWFQTDGTADFTGNPPVVVDLDITNFSVRGALKGNNACNRAQKAISISMRVQNNGPVDEPRLATVIGMQTTGVGQPDEEVYSQSMMVSDPVGGGATTWGFQNFVPDNNSSIHWIATISDDDPDEDIDTIMPAIRVCP